MESKIAVVYLSYVPYGSGLLKDFLRSYCTCSAGADHDLVVVFNGFNNKDELKEFDQVITDSKVNCEVILSSQPFDISSYFYAAQVLTNEYLLFLNSYSVILADNWLKFYYDAIQKPRVGVVGATGSGWQSGFRHFRDEAKEALWGKLPNFKAAISKLAHFGKFKGPLLRTNAFFIKRELFLSVKYHELHFAFFVPNFREESKLKTLYFEHGNRNLTYQIRDRGLKAVIIDKVGKVYEPDEWMASRTLWISNQENLLIQDNQTLRYTNGSAEERRQLTYWAWGINRPDKISE